MYKIVISIERELFIAILDYDFYMFIYWMMSIFMLAVSHVDFTIYFIIYHRIVRVSINILSDLKRRDRDVLH